MVTVRLHLDDCDESNGALRVIPGSHRLGRLSAARIAEVRSQEMAVVCSVQAGDALLMRPLLLHASSQAIAPTHRRVIHLEYASCSLPEGLVWAETSLTQASKMPPEAFVQNI
jgi:ectoine hydroxylase-related dioxygenase (phytanoyl-CoA dioxygenase family)